MKKIILLGYMGSGKSLIADLLAQKIGLPFYDLDTVIEADAGQTIAEIFLNQGEIKFRKLEHEAFRTLMDKTQSFVLSLGGGTPCYANNHLFLNGTNVQSFYLQTSIDELAKRLKNERLRRPLLANLDEVELADFIAKNLFERSYFYHHANHVVSTDGKAPETIVNEIAARLI